MHSLPAIWLRFARARAGWTSSTSKKFRVLRIFHSGALRAQARKRAAPDERMESWAGLGSF